MKRRQFVQSSFMTLPFIGGIGQKTNQDKGIKRKSIKLSLNAYSFNKELNEGSITIFDLIDFCKEHGLDAIDPTGYYFKGYPEVPTDEYIYKFKRQAFLSGIEISGSGVRNDFANADPEKLKDDLILIDEWCGVISKLGVPLLRVFAGKEVIDGRDKSLVTKQVISELKKACEIGANHGVMIALQNHNEFLKSSDEIIHVLNEVNSPWFGLHLDIGSLPIGNVYEEISALIDYAITWQVKELVWENGNKVPVNYDKLMQIILDSNYVGYLPLETLNSDPKKNIPLMVEEIQKRL